MRANVCWVGAALIAGLTLASPCAAAEAGDQPGKGSVGGQLGVSSFRMDRAMGNSWFGDYSEGAKPRFAFNGHFRYVVRPWLRWQVSGGFTWTGYNDDTRAPFTDPNFPTETSKGDYLALMIPVSAQAQYVMHHGAWIGHLGVGPGVYRVWVENHRKVLKDPSSLKLHRGIYPGASAELGVERFLKSLPSTALELTFANHLAFAVRDEQFPSGFDSNVLASEIRIGANYYFGVGAAAAKKSTEPAKPGLERP